MRILNFVGVCALSITIFLIRGAKASTVNELLIDRCSKKPVFWEVHKPQEIARPEQLTEYDRKIAECKNYVENNNFQKEAAKICLAQYPQMNENKGFDSDYGNVVRVHEGFLKCLKLVSNQAFSNDVVKFCKTGECLDKLKEIKSIPESIKFQMNLIPEECRVHKSFLDFNAFFESKLQDEAVELCVGKATIIFSDLLCGRLYECLNNIKDKEYSFVDRLRCSPPFTNWWNKEMACLRKRGKNSLGEIEKQASELTDSESTKPVEVNDTTSATQKAGDIYNPKSNIPAGNNGASQVSNTVSK